LPAGFATAVYGILDGNSGEFVYSSAGHIPPLHYHAGTATVTRLKSGLGLPLGMFETGMHGHYRESQVSLEEGDVLLLYTDGIIEVHDDNDEMFGMDGLEGLVERKLSENGELVLDLLYQDVLDMTGKSTIPDDVVLMAIRYRRRRS
ncbi:PP2C family protein-serine/threonine phosphatase, partial [Acidobacteriota bacterium]